MVVALDERRRTRRVRDVSEPIRIANCSGFFGDRLSAAREMVEGGPIDVLTGDWLAELTMLILARQRMKHGRSGYARTFLTQMEQVLGTCLDRGIKVVSQRRRARPGRAAPTPCASWPTELGLAAADRRTSRATTCCRGSTSCAAAGERARNLDTGEPLADAGMPAAHRQRLPRRLRHRRGARGRRRRRGHRPGHRRRARRRAGGLVARLGRAPTGTALAGAVRAPATSSSAAPRPPAATTRSSPRCPDLEHPGFPIAEVAADGSCVITKHDGHRRRGHRRHRHRAAALRDRRPARTSTPTSTARFDTIRARRRSARTACASAARGAAGAAER